CVGGLNTGVAAFRSTRLTARLPPRLPHLTIAEQRLADLPTLLAVERAMQSALPLAARIERVLLIAVTRSRTLGGRLTSCALIGHPM
ncbi:MAG: hypothetical protein ACRDPL_17145, partial [Propionibacteriaceae bacterium]